MQEFTVQLFDDGSAQIGGTGANLELRFGYSKNAHMYSVKFIRSEEWEDLYIRVHFHPEADIYDVEPVLAQNNIVNIPAMITSMPGEGKLTIEGTDGYKTITSADIPYRVSENSGIDEGTDPEPGESSFQQFVDAVKKDAESATQAAKDAGDILKETKEAGASALTDIETAKSAAISEIEKIETEVKGEIQEDVNSAKSSAEAAAKSAEEAKTAADSAKKSLSDLETAKESALGEISKEKDTSVSAVSSAKEAALNEISKSSDSAVKSVKTAETNAVNAVESEGSTQKTALSNASSAALTSIETAKTNAVKVVEDKASEESLAIDEKASQVIGSVQNAGDAELLAISQATNASIEQITQSAGQHLTQIDSAADEAVTDILDAKEDSLSELEGVNAHPPIQNPETGKWQVWNSESQSYVDTAYDWEGGYYSPSVDSEGNLTWESSKEGMEDIPSSNIRGPQGLGVPTPTANDYGKAPTVNAAGTGYELTGPYAPLSAAIIETAKGNPAVCEDSVEWGLQGMRVYGKSTQATTTGAQLFDVSNVLENRAYNASGELANTTGYVSSQKISCGNEQRTFTMSSSSSIAVIFCEWNEEGVLLNRLAGNSVNKSYTLNEATAQIAFTFYNNLTAADLADIMFNAGSTALPYEPYTGGKPSPSPDYPQEIHSAGDEGSVSITLSDSGDQSQTLSWDTPNGLPGIPVDSGGNFVDSDGKNFFSNLRDYFKGVDTTRVKFFHVDTSNTSKWYSLNTGEYVDLYTYLIPNDYQVGYKNIMCNILPYNAKIYAGENYGCCFNGTLTEGGNAYLLFSFDRATFNASKEDSSEIVIEKFKTYMGEDGVDIFYICDPIETPIPADELAAYRALRAYDGTTVITPDDALAEVEVDYIVKPKPYIEKKLTAIESRLNALEISEALEGE